MELYKLASCLPGAQFIAGRRLAVSWQHEPPMSMSKAEADAEEETLLLIRQREEEAMEAEAKRQEAEAQAAMVDDGDDLDDSLQEGADTGGTTGKGSGIGHSAASSGRDSYDDEGPAITGAGDGVVVVAGATSEAGVRGQGALKSGARLVSVPTVFGQHVRARAEVLESCTSVVPAAAAPWLAGIDMCARCGSLGDRQDLVCCAQCGQSAHLACLKGDEESFFQRLKRTKSHSKGRTGAELVVFDTVSKHALGAEQKGVFGTAQREEGIQTAGMDEFGDEGRVEQGPTKHLLDASWNSFAPTGRASPAGTWRCVLDDEFYSAPPSTKSDAATEEDEASPSPGYPPSFDQLASPLLAPGAQTMLGQTGLSVNGAAAGANQTGGTSRNGGPPTPLEWPSKEDWLHWSSVRKHAASRCCIVWTCGDCRNRECEPLAGLLRRDEAPPLRIGESALSFPPARARESALIWVDQVIAVTSPSAAVSG